ncbi:MAG: hypothetical protein A2Y25_09550 [Candidatus Melainabacteria bacterium GWF2_37_15]|nr:MAG: hypothetical protein A2Y25_09550 [Candidatus Melainabacteria bacterium GWF2_37_15]
MQLNGNQNQPSFGRLRWKDAKNVSDEARKGLSQLIKGKGRELRNLTEGEDVRLILNKDKHDNEHLLLSAEKFYIHKPVSKLAPKNIFHLGAVRVNLRGEKDILVEKEAGKNLKTSLGVPLSSGEPITPDSFMETLKQALDTAKRVAKYARKKAAGTLSRNDITWRKALNTLNQQA